MNDIKALLRDTKHRPSALPGGTWRYYQEWNNVVFFHWKIPFEKLRPIIPEKLILDTFEGEVYLSLVAFSMAGIRPKHLPSISIISDFHEINLRTYIINDETPGVYFLKILADKYLSVQIARLLSGLPYELSSIRTDELSYVTAHDPKGTYLDTSFAVCQKINTKSSLDHWLTERYSLYLDKSGCLYRYDLHHRPWALQAVEINRIELNYRFGDSSLNNTQPDLAHFSKGVEVLAWERHRL